jgi:hypothetical protein
MVKIRPILFVIVFLIPFILVFRALFTNSPLAWGDAPFFYDENLKALFSKPLTWDFRNSNFGLPQFHLLWLYIPTYLMGFLNHLFGLQHGILVRLIFYFPSTLLAIIGAYFFISQFTRNIYGKVLGSFLYGFNTYFLTLLDGGQIGIALAYGIFPLALLTFRNLLLTSNLKTFLLAVVSLTILSNVDIRIALLSLFTTFFLVLIDRFPRKNWLFFLPVITLVIGLDSYWIVPFIEADKSSFNLTYSGQNFLSILNGLLLFNPHFPNNEFGQITRPPFYFFLVPVIVFGGLFLKRDKRSLYFSLILLMFVFLLKGSAEPFGFLYSWFLNHIPFATAFRDSSKFFQPIIILSAILLALTVEKLTIIFRNKKGIMMFILLYFYLLLLIWPAVLGQMSGTLASSSKKQDYQIIYDHLKSQSPFYRTLWFPEVPPLAFSTQAKEAISANLLYQEIPFASLIIGNYDLFYFLHSSQITDWFRLLGIKYAFLPENERKKTWTEQERYERNLFLNFVSSLPNFKRLDWGTSFPVYQVSDPYPKIFGIDKVNLVVGGTDIYKQHSPLHGAFIFLEDGLSDIDTIKNLPNDSVNLIFKDRDRVDLTMLFLSKFFNNQTVSSSAWGYFNGSQYLESKYKLLQEGVDSSDLQFGKGFHFSTITNEKIIFSENGRDSGRYRLIFRSISSTQSAGIKYKVGSEENQVKNTDRFRWTVSTPLNLKGVQKIEFENLGGFNALNLVALIKEEEFSNAEESAASFIEKFPQSDIALSISEIPYQQVNPTKYEVSLSQEGPRWIVFTDHFNTHWQLHGNSPQPLYSMVNGFLIDKDSSDKLVLQYTPQSQVDKGIKLSIVALAVFSSLVLLATWKKLG